jgi:hypothetical protein
LDGTIVHQEMAFQTPRRTLNTPSSNTSGHEVAKRQRLCYDVEENDKTMVIISPDLDMKLPISEYNGFVKQAKLPSTFAILLMKRFFTGDELSSSTYRGATSTDGIIQKKALCNDPRLQCILKQTERQYGSLCMKNISKAITNVCSYKH